MMHLSSHNVKATTRTSFKRQRARVTDNLECKICHTKFRDKSGVYDDEKKDYSCPVCEKKFKTKSNLERHIKQAYCHKRKTVEVD
jgi:stress-induced morphogen